MKLGTLPYGFDHKYIYSHIGYNLKVTDIQAAIGIEQLKKLPEFKKRRKENFKRYFEYFSKHKEYFYLPSWEKQSDPCWFGFMVVIRDNAPFDRLKLVNYLQSNMIETRSLFSGNLVRHPAYTGAKYNIYGNLKNTDLIAKSGFWIGVYPGLGTKQTDYVVKKLDEFLKA